jgi:hypothetical protein
VAVSKGEMIVRFADIGDRRCVNFIFIIFLMQALAQTKTVPDRIQNYLQAHLRNYYYS